MKKISLKKLLKLQNPMIYDIRSSENFKKFNIRNSINIPYFELRVHYKKILNKNEIYYIICDEGYMSKKLVKFLTKEKYKVIHVKRGIKNLNKFNL